MMMIRAMSSSVGAKFTAWHCGDSSPTFLTLPTFTSVAFVTFYLPFLYGVPAVNREIIIRFDTTIFNGLRRDFVFPQGLFLRLLALVSCDIEQAVERLRVDLTGVFDHDPIVSDDPARLRLC